MASEVPVHGFLCLIYGRPVWNWELEAKENAKSWQSERKSTTVQERKKGGEQSVRVKDQAFSMWVLQGYLKAKPLQEGAARKIPLIFSDWCGPDGEGMWRMRQCSDTLLGWWQEQLIRFALKFWNIGKNPEIIEWYDCQIILCYFPLATLNLETFFRVLASINDVN